MMRIVRVVQMGSLCVVGLLLVACSEDASSGPSPGSGGSSGSAGSSGAAGSTPSGGSGGSETTGGTGGSHPDGGIDASDSGTDAAPVCGPPASPGASLTATNSDICPQGWCFLAPNPVGGGFYDAVLFDDGWALLVEGAVLASTPQGDVSLGELPNTGFEALWGTSLTDLYVTASNQEDVVYHFDGKAWSPVTADPGAYNHEPTRMMPGPSGALYLLDLWGVYRADSCGLTSLFDLSTAPGLWVHDDDHIVATSIEGLLYRWKAGTLTTVSLEDSVPDAPLGVNEFSVTDVAALDDTDEYVATMHGIVRLETGVASAAWTGGPVWALTVRPAHGTSPAEIVALARLGAIDGPWTLVQGAGTTWTMSPGPEALDTTDPYWFDDQGAVIRAQHDKTLVIARSPGQLFVGDPGGWTPWIDYPAGSIGPVAGSGPSNAYLGWDDAIMHWNGNSFTPVPSAPATSGLWVSPTGMLHSVSLYDEEYSRWNGTTWTKMQVPMQAYTHGTVFTGWSDDELYWGLANSGDVKRYDGSQWTDVATGCEGIFDIAVAGPGHVYAVGPDCGIREFKSGSWSLVEGTAGLTYYGIAAASPSNIMAVGSFRMARLDGSTWVTSDQITPTTIAHDGADDFFGISHSGGGDTSLYRWTGTQWEYVATTPAPVRDMKVWPDAILASGAGNLMRRAR